MWYRHCIRASVGLEDFYIRWFAYYFRLHQRYSVLLGKPRCIKSGRDVPPQQSSRSVDEILPFFL